MFNQPEKAVSVAKLDRNSSGNQGVSRQKDAKQVLTSMLFEAFDIILCPSIYFYTILIAVINHQSQTLEDLSDTCIFWAIGLLIFQSQHRFTGLTWIVLQFPDVRQRAQARLQGDCRFQDFGDLGVALLIMPLTITYSLHR